MQRRGGPGQAAREGPGPGGVGGGAPVQSEAGGRSQVRPCPDKRADWVM